MAFVVPTKRGRFEIRESRNTPKGPRSRTLASFEELTDEVIEKARRKTAKPPSAEELRNAARRVGAPVARPPADQAARQLIAELGKGREPEPRLRRLLAAKLDDGADGAISPSDPSRAMAEWMVATPAERGKALKDLLLLADALPSGGRRGKPLRFPRLESARA
jgi:hypothetical protein